MAFSCVDMMVQWLDYQIDGSSVQVEVPKKNRKQKNFFADSPLLHNENWQNQKFVADRPGYLRKTAFSADSPLWHETLVPNKSLGVENLIFSKSADSPLSPDDNDMCDDQRKNEKVELPNFE